MSVNGKHKEIQGNTGNTGEHREYMGTQGIHGNTGNTWKDKEYMETQGIHGNTTKQKIAKEHNPCKQNGKMPC